MAPLLNGLRSAISFGRGGHPVCIVCGRTVSSRQEPLKLRGGTIVHRECATYDLRRRRTGAARLGYPRTR